jgi:hypothetical protein
MESTTSPDQKAAALAALQHGAISLPQALAQGFSPDQIRHRVKSGRWIRARQGVFVLAGAPPTWQQATMVACLGGSDGARASHRSAAALHGLLDPPALPELTVPRQGNVRQPGATVHRSTILSADTTALAEIPVTTAARTVVDCASFLDYDALCELVDDALCERLCTTTDIAHAMDRAAQGPGRAGLANLEEALSVWTPGLMPGSRAEMRLIRRLSRWGFPRPERQVKVFDARGRFVGRLDVGWRDRTTGLEYYGERHHGPRQAQHDERRMGRIGAAGWDARVVRKEDLNGRRAQALQRWLSERLASCPASKAGATSGT